VGGTACMVYRASHLRRPALSSPPRRCASRGARLDCVVKAMRYRDVQRALVSEGCTHKSTRGSHEKWICPCGQHQAIVPNHKIVSPGVVNDTIKKLTCLQKGWLQ
jgi:predicted RNA binding protein YcfA (HicA-like mRNA interferase family)